MALGEEAIVPALDYLFHRVEQGFDGAHAHDPRRGVALSAPPDLRAPPAGLAEDAAEEERLRRLRDPGGRRRRQQPDPRDDPRRLPDEDLPAGRGGADAPDRRGVPGFGLTETEIADPRAARRRSATTTTGRSAAAACSRSISARWPSRSPAMSSPADQRFLDDLRRRRHRLPSTPSSSSATAVSSTAASGSRQRRDAGLAHIRS